MFITKPIIENQTERLLVSAIIRREKLLIMPHPKYACATSSSKNLQTSLWLQELQLGSLKAIPNTKPHHNGKCEWYTTPGKPPNYATNELEGGLTSQVSTNKTSSHRKNQQTKPQVGFSSFRIEGFPKSQLPS